MDSELISIIVPVYNVERYIDTCISSLLSQTYRNIECIIINDGSNDSSWSICQKWAHEDHRIRLFTQKNLGVSSARNRGIQLSKGKYIIFVDSDDYLESTHVEDLYSAITLKDVDLAVQNYCDIKSDGRRVVRGEHESKILTAKSYLESLIDRSTGSVCFKLFKKDIIKNFHLSFRTDVSNFEDLLFLSKYLEHCALVVYDDKVGYCRIVRLDGVSFSKYSSHKLTAIKALDEMIADLSQDKRLQKKVVRNKLNTLLWFMYQDFKSESKDQTKIKSEILITLKRYPSVIGVKESIKLFSMFTNPRIYEILRNFVRRSN